MKKRPLPFLASFLTAMAAMPAFAEPVAVDPGSAIYELRIYHAAAGRLEALNARFREHRLTPSRSTA